MRTTVAIALLTLLVMFAAGCSGDGKLQTRGKVVKGGQPMTLPDNEYLRLIFIPDTPGERARDTYVAEYNRKDATFRVAGKDLRGMPPGKYKIMVEHLRGKEDLLKGAYSGEGSPFECEVHSSSDFVTVDMDQKSKPVQAPQSARNANQDLERGERR